MMRSESDQHKVPRGPATRAMTPNTLTNRVRRIMSAHPALRIAARRAITVGRAWLPGHFLLVDPLAHPGALMWVGRLGRTAEASPPLKGSTRAVGSARSGACAQTTQRRYSGPGI
jgi:hypothetical protein